MENTIVHITLPRGIKTTDGAVLNTDLTFDVISRLNPYYCSVDQVRLAGGMVIRKLSDLTVACQVYNSSREADLLCLHPPTGTESDEFKLFVGARNQWVTAVAARDLILNVNELLGRAGSHVLANFSVQRQADREGEGISGRLKELNDSIKTYEVSIRSGGRTAPGGRPEFGMAAKGAYDWMEKTPSRTWIANGMGSNATSAEFINLGTGGRGKPVHFFASSFYAPPLVNMRYGIYPSGYPLPVTFIWPNSRA